VQKFAAWCKNSPFSNIPKFNKEFLQNLRRTFPTLKIDPPQNKPKNIWRDRFTRSPERRANVGFRLTPASRTVIFQVCLHLKTKNEVQKQRLAVLSNK
jgi:hypothetical protein